MWGVMRVYEWLVMGKFLGHVRGYRGEVVTVGERPTAPLPGVTARGEGNGFLPGPARLPEIERRCRNFSAVLVSKTSGGREFAESRFTYATK